MQQLPQHHLVLQVEPVNGAHLIDLVLVVLRITVALDIFLEQVWLLEVEVPLLHQVLGVLDVNEQLEDAVVLPVNGLLVNNDFDGPLAVVGHTYSLQVLQRAKIHPSPLPLPIFKLDIHIAHDGVFVEIR